LKPKHSHPLRRASSFLNTQYAKANALQVE